MKIRPTGLIIVIVVVIVMIAALIRYTNTNLRSPSSKLLPLSAPGDIIHALVATSTADQEKGLGDRDSLPIDQGMFFIFSTPGSYGFWMKDMRFSLDMVWIGADKTVAGVTSSISPETYPNLFLPPHPISYVLELNAGQAEKLGIATGTALVF